MKKPPDVTVSRRDIKWLLDYAQEERDVDYESNWSYVTKQVEPDGVRKRLEKFDKIATSIRAALSG